MHRSPEHRRGAGHDAVGGHDGLVHTEQGGAVLGVHAELLEGAGVYEIGDALAGRELARLVLLGVPLLTPPAITSPRRVRSSSIRSAMVLVEDWAVAVLSDIGIRHFLDWIRRGRRRRCACGR
ncbi:hypothetical protein GCM10025862_29890 [Arsenicicoccus piscis]|uniref:Uncharacterized protein n=1 Tax=Arsenicicoccus piscis TaxID=673954 RepID=A0ABQ6HR87_9MICO|nr:hypothetical protein GCM10025862_29890 [Arsenicicoccus piscis]